MSACVHKCLEKSINDILKYSENWLQCLTARPKLSLCVFLQFFCFCFKTKYGCPRDEEFLNVRKNFRFKNTVNGQHSNAWGISGSSNCDFLF